MQVELGFLLLFAAAFALWTWSVKGRETVDRQSTKVCAELGLQRLDQSVALRRVWVQRYRDKLGVLRTYSFEYSTNGSDRHLGEICLIDARPAWAHLQHPDGPIHIELRRS